MSFKNILYAEDDPNDVIIFSMAFKRAALRHPLYFVDDGQAAIDWLAGKGAYSDRAKHPLPDAVILDLKMPRRTGFEVLRWLRGQEEFKQLPAIVLSSSDVPADVKLARELGVTAYFTKSPLYLDVTQYLSVSL